MDISKLDIQSGNIYTLSGPNGAGKTTFLNILSFLLIPSSGRLAYLNIPVKYNEKYLQQLRKSVILVDQHPILFSTSVYKNIEFGLKVRKISRKKRKTIIESALDLVDMKMFINADARHLSGGETRRIAIARAIACSPDVLLLDEPTADLDLESRLTIENIIREIHARKDITIIFCTHDLSQASRLTSKNIYFLNGQIHDIYHENIFKGELVTSNQKEYYCKINEKILIPVQSTDKDKIKISIHPGMINIIDHKKSDSDVSLSYTGRVTHLGMEKEKIRAVIDIGISVSVLMEKAEYDLHMLRLNDSVKINFDVDGITII
ncbi:MAG: ATP-binding cassette domain-containing protein [Desulfobacteraceae bacterium]|nr:ATP-binding cassette domain-containing protein [Desulfobacteraceae bacterium]MBC2756488.1 ATP-binding cassette domain-containing protein [Desulfobacteraceae bacterium]